MRDRGFEVRVLASAKRVVFAQTEVEVVAEKVDTVIVEVVAVVGVDEEAERVVEGLCRKAIHCKNVGTFRAMILGCSR